MKEKSTDYKYFRSYASYLLKNHVPELAQRLLANKRLYNQPLLKFIENYDEADVLKKIEASYRKLLGYVVDGDFGQTLIDSDNFWEKNEYQKFGNEEISSLDITIEYNSRKKALIHFLPGYSEDVTEVVNVVNDIEDFYIIRVNSAIELYSEGQQKKLQKVIEYQKTAESELKASEKQLREAQKLAHLGYWEVDINTQMAKWSDELYNIYGVPKDKELTLDYISEFFEEKEFEGLKKKIVTAHEKGIPYQHKYQITRLDGKKRTLLSRGYPEFDDDGNVVLVRGITFDITKLHKAEEGLRSSQKMLSQIEKTMPLIIFILDVNTDKVLYTNKAGYSMVPFSHDEIASGGYSLLKKIVHPDDWPALYERRKGYNIMKEGDSTSLEFRMKDKYDQWHWIYSKTVVFKRKRNGEVDQVLITSTDISELKKAEKELEENARFISKIADTSPNMIYIYDLKKRVNIYANKQVSEVMGYDMSDLKSFGDKVLDEIIHPDDLPKINAHYDRFRETKEGDVKEVEYRLKAKNNEWRWFVDKGSVFKSDEDGVPIQVIGITQDITGRVEAEESIKDKNKELTEAYDKLADAQKELQTMNDELEERVEQRTIELAKSRERYKAFIRQSQEGIWRYELNASDYIDTELPPKEQLEIFLRKAFIAECNDRMAQMYGFRHAREFMGMKVSEFMKFSDNYERDLGNALKFVLAGYKLENIESKERNIDGEYRYYTTNMVGIVENKLLKRVWGTQVDITDKKLAEKALKASEERYRFLAENVPQLFWAADGEGKLEYFNQNWYKYTGMKEIPDKKWSWLDYVHPDDLKACVRKLDESLEKEKLFEAECRIRKNNNTYEWFLARALPYKHNEGQIKWWIGTFTDINYRKIVEERLAKRNDDLIKINQDLDNFVYTASHDLKAPIANIEGLLSTVKASLDPVKCIDDDVDAIFDMMTTSIERFQKTIRDLTDITKVQKSEREEEEEVEFEKVLNDTESTIADLISTTHTNIITDFSDAPTINFSKKSIRSIFYNLLSNSIKFRDPHRDPEVIVKTEKTKDWIILSVQDNGLGIGEENREKVFGMFKRLHDHVEGSGVGLYIVKRVITNAGGKIELESEEGKGTTFKLYFKRED